MINHATSIQRIGCDLLSGAHYFFWNLMQMSTAAEFIRCIFSRFNIGKNSVSLSLRKRVFEMKRPPEWPRPSSVPSPTSKLSLYPSEVR